MSALCFLGCIDSPETRAYSAKEKMNRKLERPEKR